MPKTKYKGLGQVLLVLLLFSLSLGQSHAQDKPLLKGADGKFISGEILRISGSDAEVATLDGSTIRIPIEHLSEDSQKAVWAWGLAKVLPNPQMLKIQPRISRSEHGSRGYEITLTNQSPMEIPAGLEIQYGIRVDKREITVTNTRERGANGDNQSNKQRSVQILASQHEGYSLHSEKIPQGGSWSFKTHLAANPNDHPRSSPHASNYSQQTFTESSLAEIQLKLFYAGSELRHWQQYAQSDSFLEDPELSFPALDNLSSYDPRHPDYAGRRPQKTEPLPLLDLAEMNNASEPDEDGDPFASRAVPTKSVPKAPINYSALLVVEGDDGVGSGFLAEIKGRYFIVTNIHVIAGNKNVQFKTADGDEIAHPRNFFISKDRDIAIFPIEKPEEYYKTSENITDLADIGDLVTVYGNEGGASVVTRLQGAINGIGPDRIEVDAEFIPGNSGSPVIHRETGTVIGIASFLIEYDLDESGRSRERDDNDDQGNPPYSRNPEEKPPEAHQKTRRFAERLDKEKDWEQTNLATLRREAKELEAYTETVLGVMDVSIGIMQQSRIISSGKAREPIRWRIEEFHRIYDNSRQRGSEGNLRALETLKRNLISDMDSDYQRGMKNINSGYFKREMKRHRQLNEAIRDYLEGVYTY
ncbi:serine protease [Rubellicoccus peritrichatus]|uniref:Serine protease n=1 Tax=Rubellicoccus peritrichatus TaxID=3080537 RepID=A0AAQ3QS52_9BACT|nr:serine protease [Puniceicoccus sp. CR14]WOO39991.1 serine protease [Puniceicoccus sp. CR14]